MKFQHLVCQQPGGLEPQPFRKRKGGNSCASQFFSNVGNLGETSADILVGLGAFLNLSPTPQSDTSVRQEGGGDRRGFWVVARILAQVLRL